MAYSENYDNPPSSSLNYSTLNENRPYCRAIFDFKGEYDNELSFVTGEIIYLNRKVNDEWLEGESQKSGLSGIFPFGFVEIVVDLLEQQLDSNIVSTKDISSIGIACVLNDFVARYGDELTLKAGDSVNIIEIIDDNWAKCQNIAENEQIGLVPISYLQIFLDNDDNISLENRNSVHSLESNNSSSKYIPWDNFFNTTSKTETIQSHPPVPSVEPFNVLEFDNFQKNTIEKKKNPPFRPPPPKIVNDRKNSSTTKKLQKNETREIFAIPNSNILNQLPLNCLKEGLNEKEKVVQDLLSTEIVYLFDLNAWESCINSSTQLEEQKKKILTNGLDLLKTLSQRLMDNIKLEKEKPEEKQCFGEMFMEMREQFFRTFSFHCRSVEQISQILENNVDSNLQEVLNNCLSEMRKLGSNIFDVPTAVSRPIQRCLKYPLYVGELLKNTQITHIDHPKLMEALKQLGNLASKMNECKRRKELIQKYRGNQQLTLGERLSRINIHSLIKKSNRLKYRLSSSIGLNTIRDPEFDYLITSLDTAERKVCKFLYCAQIYRKYIELAFKKHEESYKGVYSLQDNANVISAFATMFRNIDTIYRKFCRTFEKKIINEGRQLVQVELTKLIHKRCDKLADYETAKATNKNIDEIEMRKNEYEALNAQVKSSLPKVISTINKEVRNLVPNAPDFTFFVVKYRFMELDKLYEIKSIERKKSTSESDRRSLRISKRLSFKTNRCQSIKERDALIKMMKAQNKIGDLRKVQKAFKSDKITLEVNDIVIIYEHKFGACLCDNGVAKDFVPLDNLQTYEDNFLCSPEKPLITFQEEGNFFDKNKSSKLNSKSSLEANLIDLDSPTKMDFKRQNSIDPELASIGFNDEFLLINYDKEPPPGRKTAASEIPFSMWENNHQESDYFDPFSNRNLATHFNNNQNKFKSKDPFEDLFKIALNTPLSKVKKPELVVDKSSDSPLEIQKTSLNNQNLFGSTVSLPKSIPLIPVRMAPLPPPLPAPLKDLSGLVQPTSSNFVQCSYEFTPDRNDTNQISILEGESVEVQQKHDDAGNVEWWLVKKSNGESGYVPASYLSEQS